MVDFFILQMYLSVVVHVDLLHVLVFHVTCLATRSFFFVATNVYLWRAEDFGFVWYVQMSPGFLAGS